MKQTRYSIRSPVHILTSYCLIKTDWRRIHLDCHRNKLTWQRRKKQHSRNSLTNMVSTTNSKHMVIRWEIPLLENEKARLDMSGLKMKYPIIELGYGTIVLCSKYPGNPSTNDAAICLNLVNISSRTQTCWVV